MTAKTANKVLVLTVGRGEIGRAEETLLGPIKKSLDKGAWSRVVLLPSKGSESLAKELKGYLQGIALDIRPMGKEDQEFNVDECYRHFNAVLEGLALEHGSSRLVVDYTKGTKPMSMALVMAAIRNDVSLLRYTTGGRTDHKGKVIPGTEVVNERSPRTILDHRLLDQARSFFRQGNFAAAMDVLPNPDGTLSAIWPPEVLNLYRAVRAAADFYCAWDRLDYAGASREYRAGGHDLSGFPLWKDYSPVKAMGSWVERLAEHVPPTDRQDMAAKLGLLVVDLLANGERRIRDLHTEDAVLRAYRVLELVGQMRLFSRGLDSGSLPPDLKEIKTLEKKLDKKGSRERFGSNTDGTLRAARFLTARLLNELRDPLAKRLLKLGDQKLLLGRNRSVLIHGFDALSTGDINELKALYRELEKLVTDAVDGDVDKNLAVARSMDFSRV